MKHPVAFSVIYSLVYLATAVLPVNPEGTGPMIFCIGPGATWALVLIAVFLSRRSSTLRNKIAFVLLLLLHYGITVAIVFDSWNDQLPRIKKMIGYGEWWLIGFLMIWYAIGQLLIWVTFIVENLRHGDRQSST